MYTVRYFLHLRDLIGKDKSLVTIDIAQPNPNIKNAKLTKRNVT